MKTKEEREIALLEALLAEDDLAEGMTACPEPETLVALAEDGQRGDAALRAHVAGCRTCADLLARVRSFDEAADGVHGGAVAEQEWVEAEPRLDRWMTGYLKSHGVGRRAALAPVPEKQGLPLVGFLARRFGGVAWGLPMAAAVCAVALLVVGVVELRRGEGPHGTEMGRLTPVPAATPHAGGAAAENGMGKDGTVLMSERKDGSGSLASAEAKPVQFSGEEILSLKLTLVAPQTDGTFRVSATVLPVTAAQDQFAGVELSGVVAAGGGGHPATFAVERVERNEMAYRAFPVAAAEDERPLMMDVVDVDSGPRVGDTLQMKVGRDQMYVVTGP